MWHVRHSALFALPAILPRLTPSHRRSFALSVLNNLSHDTSASVRLRVLESLGEVLYTFRDDPGGPPPELLRLFLGKEDSQPPTPQQQLQQDQQVNQPSPKPLSWPPRPPAKLPPLNPLVPETPMPQPTPWSEDDVFFEDPARPLIIAFNFPALALTLGRDRWNEIRNTYLRLAESSSPKVRRTLAASAGEVAKIVGPEVAVRDVLPVWCAAMRSSEGETQIKAAEAAGRLVQALEGREGQRTRVVGVVEECWGVSLRGWKEKEVVVRVLGELVLGEGEKEGEGVGREGWEVVRRLVSRALVDDVAAVREAAIAVVSITPPSFIIIWSFELHYRRHFTRYRY